MTYKTTARQMHFRAQEGSSSVRGTQRGYGGLSLRGEELTILPTLKEQAVSIRARIDLLEQQLKVAPTSSERERLRSVLASAIAEYGNAKKTLSAGCNLARERIFVNVARARLPESIFYTIMDEASEIWSSEGFPAFLPEPTSAQKKKTIRNNIWREERRSGR